MVNNEQWEAVPRGRFPRPEQVQGNTMKPAYKLDRIDVNILAVLQRNGRITNVELAEEVNLSPSPCLMRVKKLQQAGYILGYSAQIDLARLGSTMTVFTEFTLKNHRQIDFARFQEALEKIDACVECHLVSGGYDYLVKFVTGGIPVHRGGADRPGGGYRQVFQFCRAQDTLLAPAYRSDTPVRRSGLGV